MVEEKVYSREEAIKKGYLQNKKVYLKPVIRKGDRMITDPAHMGYFMWEGARKAFVLPTNKYNELVNPFKNEEETNYLSKLIDVDLNPRKTSNNYWYDFEVPITKTAVFMKEGIEYNLADPMDNLRVRVLKLQEEVAPSWDQRFEKPTYKFALVEDDYEEKEANDEMKMFEDIYTFWGEIKSSLEKQREFLGAYYMHKKVNKHVGTDANKEFLTKEIQKVIKEDKDTVYTLIKDEDAPFRYFIYRAVLKGLILKKGVSTYYIVGTDEQEFTLKTLIEHLKFLKEHTDPVYLKLKAQLNSDD
jgi:hypothetical protein